MDISIINSEQYFKRKDLKSIPWFAVPNNILEHPDFFNITGDELKAFIWIISVAAKSKKMEFTLDTKHAAYMTRINEKHFHSCIEKLEGKRFQVIEIKRDVTNPLRECDESVTNPYGFVPNITERTERTRQDTTERMAPNGPSSEPPLGVHEDLCVEYTFPFLQKVQSQVQNGWIEAYKDISFINQELTKAVTWIHENPHKAPKSRFSSFFSRWLGRAWETHRKSLRGTARADGINRTMGVLGG